MNSALYAVKKRKKPVQKIPKAPPLGGTKSNPSKRHRDRLNGELDTLTSLLPFSDEVRARLDKLSVLRLSVGYLKVKSFFNATLKKGLGGVNVAPAQSSSQPQTTSIEGDSLSEGDLLLQALNGFVLVVSAEGYVFYTSSTIQDFLGFHQSDVVHQSVFELIHTDDRALFRQQLHFALDSNTSTNDQNSVEVSTNLVTYDPATIPQENSSFLERNFCCRFRCLLDNSSGFLALNFFGRLKLLHGQTQQSEDGAPPPPQLALFSVATPLQPPSILEIRSKTLLFQTKHKLDFSPMGIDARGSLILGYTEQELCAPESGYHFVHAADMMYCADQHLRMMKTGETGSTFFRLITKTNSWMWVQSNARLVFKGGKPDFIITRMKALTNEEGEEHLRLRRLQLPFNCASGDALLYDTTLTLDPSDQCSAPKIGRMDNAPTPKSILGTLLGQDQSLYCPHKPPSLSTINDEAFRDSHATVAVPGDMWLQSSTLMKTESTVQDMMDTLQQILRDDSLVSSLQVEPEELRGWESTLMSINTTSKEVNSDLNSVISSDILSYVEEQFQKEGGFMFLDRLNEASMSTQEPHSQSLWPNYAAQTVGQTSFMPKAESQGHALSPQGYTFGTENHNTLQGLGQACRSQCVKGAGSLWSPHTAPPPPPLHHLDMQMPLQHDVSISSVQGNCQLPNPPGSFDPEPFTSCISNQNLKKQPFLPTVHLQAAACTPQRQAQIQAQRQHNAFSHTHQTTDFSLLSAGNQSHFAGAGEGCLPQSSSCMFSKDVPQANGVCSTSEQPPALSRMHCLYQRQKQGTSQPPELSWPAMGDRVFNPASVPQEGPFCWEDK